MKLIIDIDDEMVCNDIKSKALEPTSATDEIIINALYNGIPYEEGPQGEWKEDAFSIICPFCGMPIEDEVRYLYPDDFDLNFCPNCGKKLGWKGEEE